MSQQIDHAMVDILMPTYKPDLYLLERAIKSIKSQTFQQWRLYLIENGGSTISDDFISALNDQRIVYKNLESKGKPNALNYALTISGSRHIAYLDDDDIWFPNHLSDVLSALQTQCSNFVFSDAYEVMIDRTGNTFRETGRRNLSRGVITEKTLWYISHINVIHTRDLVVSSGAYDDSRSYFIDWDMLQRMAQIERPYHLKKFTCEHYIYLDSSQKKTNTISSQHLSDPAKSKQMHDDMFRRAFSLLTPDDFVDIAKDTQEKIRLIENLEKTRDGAQLSMEKNQEVAQLKTTIADLEKAVADLKSSYSWRITKPLRSIFDLTRRLASH